MWSVKGPGAQDHKARALTHTQGSHSAGPLPTPPVCCSWPCWNWAKLLFWTRQKLRVLESKLSESRRSKPDPISWSALSFPGRLDLQDLRTCSRLVGRLGPKSWVLPSLPSGLLVCFPAHVPAIGITDSQLLHKGHYKLVVYGYVFGSHNYYKMEFLWQHRKIRISHSKSRVSDCLDKPGGSYVAESWVVLAPVEGMRCSAQHPSDSKVACLVAVGTGLGPLLCEPGSALPLWVGAVLFLWAGSQMLWGASFHTLLAALRWTTKAQGLRGPQGRENE